ncbi:response regulator [Aureimonas mangrovi]|uniref:response regulator n=1 Tax=Aureimonas mangrovi TaxID=2758041 RepID=UPI00163D5B17|nr:response regulator [Aureimonas mangrovi]
MAHRVIEMADRMALEGKNVLLIEDEFVIAMDIEAELESAGAHVTCASRVQEAASAVEDGGYDAAILDLNLHGEVSFPVADLLVAKGVPFLFHTGHGVREKLENRYPGAVVCNKPCTHTDLIRSLDSVISARCA